MPVFVRHDDVISALRVLKEKKKVQRQGTFRGMRQRSACENPSEPRAREKAEAMRRPGNAWRKRRERERDWGARRRDEQRRSSEAL